MECQTKQTELLLCHCLCDKTPTRNISRPIKLISERQLPLIHRLVACNRRSSSICSISRCIQPVHECFRDISNSIKLVITKISTPEAICVCVKSNYSPRVVNWQTTLLKAGISRMLESSTATAQKRIRLQLKSCWNRLEWSATKALVGLQLYPEVNS